jgi:hypothetical protein
MDLAAEQGIDLPVVVGVENVIERQAPFAKVTPEALPDGDHLRVVGHGPEYQGFS